MNIAVTFDNNHSPEIQALATDEVDLNAQGEGNLHIAIIKDSSLNIVDF